MQLNTIYEIPFLVLGGYEHTFDTIYIKSHFWYLGGTSTLLILYILNPIFGTWGYEHTFDTIYIKSHFWYLGGTSTLLILYI